VVYKHIISFFRNVPSANIGYYRNAKNNQKEIDVVIDLPKEKILCEVKYRNDSSVPETDAIVALSNDENNSVSHSFVITKSLSNYGISRHRTRVPIFRIPVLPFVYMLGVAESRGDGGKL
jgi:predicted AAA+ superfamily ATPase